jgi:hypothetical protein
MSATPSKPGGVGAGAPTPAKGGAAGGAGSATSTPSSTRSAAGGAGSSAPTPSGGKALLTVLGSGAGGVRELGSKLDPSTVTFAVVRVPMGSGTFARNKVVLLHVNSGACLRAFVGLGVEGGGGG